MTTVKSILRLNTGFFESFNNKGIIDYGKFGFEDKACSLVAVAVTMSASTILYFIVPGVIDEIRAGEVVGMQVGPELLLVMAVTYFWVPLVVAVLSLTLKDKANRWANIILGIFYAGFILFELIMNIITVAYPYVILMDTSVIVVAALIAWNAYKWPKQEA